MDAVILATLVVGGTGLVCAVALSIVAKAFAVYEDPRIAELGDMLPGANCGGCGYAGCADYAKAVVLNDGDVTLCAPGGSGIVEQISQFMGVEASAGERKVAIVLCRGDSDNAPRKFAYNGVADCAAAAKVGGGDKKCSYGCLGYGSCARVCPTEAVEITPNNIAVIHPDLCISCGACVKACPRALIQLIPQSRNTHVMCNSHDKGPIAKKACKVACIGCTVCAKLAEDDAIKMDRFLAVVDYSKELDNDKVIEKCPAKCIVKTTT